MTKITPERLNQLENARTKWQLCPHTDDLDHLAEDTRAILYSEFVGMLLRNAVDLINTIRQQWIEIDELRADRGVIQRRWERAASKLSERKE
jgi:hypothetical protein